MFIHTFWRLSWMKWKFAVKWNEINLHQTLNLITDIKHTRSNIVEFPPNDATHSATDLRQHFDDANNQIRMVEKNVFDYDTFPWPFSNGRERASGK
jgi:hypothetical protein